MVPKKLNADEKARRNEASGEMLQWLETDPDFLNRVIRGDESRLFEYDLKPRDKARNDTRLTLQDGRKLA
jgi:hypothetical protein